MLQPFLGILFGALVRKHHDLSRDDIVVAIYDLAAVDFDGFFRAVGATLVPCSVLPPPPPRCV
jgi:hypothetical protein